MKTPKKNLCCAYGIDDLLYARSRHDICTILEEHTLQRWTLRLRKTHISRLEQQDLPPQDSVSFLPAGYLLLNTETLAETRLSLSEYEFHLRQFRRFHCSSIVTLLEHYTYCDITGRSGSVPIEILQFQENERMAVVTFESAEQMNRFVWPHWLIALPEALLTSGGL